VKAVITSQLSCPLSLAVIQYLFALSSKHMLVYYTFILFLSNFYKYTISYIADLYYICSVKVCLGEKILIYHIRLNKWYSAIFHFYHLTEQFIIDHLLCCLINNDTLCTCIYAFFITSFFVVFCINQYMQLYTNTRSLYLKKSKFILA